MINSSHIYKNELRLNIETMKNMVTQINLEKPYWSFEKSIFTSAYMIRKLIENYKLSDAVTSLSIPILEVPLQENVFIDFLNNHKIDEKYNWSLLKKSSLGIKEVANQLMHSFVFNVISTEMDHFLAINTFERKQKLNVFNLKNLELLFHAAASDDVVSAHYHKKMVFLPDGQLDLTQPRVPVTMERNIHCEPIMKVVSFDEEQVEFFSSIVVEEQN